MEVHEVTLTGDRAEAFSRMMEALAAKERPASLDPEMAIQRLKDHFADYSRKHEFKPGDIVRFKEGLSAINPEGAKTPFIVLQKLQYPITGDSHGPGAEYGANLDLRVATINKDGRFTIVLFESALFEPWPMIGTQDTQP